MGGPGGGGDDGTKKGGGFAGANGRVGTSQWRIAYVEGLHAAPDPAHVLASPPSVPLISFFVPLHSRRADRRLGFRQRTGG